MEGGILKVWSHAGRIREVTADYERTRVALRNSYAPTLIAQKVGYSQNAKVE